MRYLLAADALLGSAFGSEAFPDAYIPPDETNPVVRFSPEIGTAPDLPEDAGAGSGAALQPLDQTFFLHSRPGVTKVIYLDFDGHTTSGTSWNTSYTAGADFVTPAYSFQGDTNSFTNAELERIQYIWERVAEDFLPFDVNVTTQDPGVEALRKVGGSDTQWGIRVVIGGSSSDWYGSGAGGVAYLNSFNWSSDTPCFVFENNLNNGSEKSTAEAISHEIGHTLSLSHDGTSSVTYYRGHGSGATGWAPIMGVGYDQQLTQWSKGEYPDANQTQDDLSRITTLNGFGYRPDDHGNSIATATPLSISSTVVFNEGIIERTTDLDFFTFTFGGGSINLNFAPFYRSPNLDILATLYNSAGVVLATSNPVSALTANFNQLLVPGTYYVSVDGTGKPANGTDYGYSDYGSLGYYSITGTIVETVSPGVDLYGSSFAVQPSNLFFAAGFVDVSFSVENYGAATAPAFDVKFYLSQDSTIDAATDLPLTLDPASPFHDPSDPAGYRVPAGLATFGVHPATVRLAVPANDPFAAGGQYFIGMIVDADNDIAEANETNNRNRGPGLDLQTVDFAPIFTNPASISIPSSGAGNPYPSNIVVSGLVGSVVDVNVSLFGITHTNPDDLDILLVSPSGQKVILLSDVGGTGDITGVNLVLDDQAAASMPDSTLLTSGTYRPTNIGTGDSFTSPAPAGPYSATLAVFQGLDPQGTWSLYVMDDAGGNSGSISGGWALTFTLADAAPTNPANVLLTAIIEDVAPTANVGNSIASIVAAAGSVDPEGSPLGLAVTSVDNTHGQWQFSTDSGQSWFDLLTASTASARLLAPSHSVRFVPSPDFNSTIAAAQLGFKTWDQTNGTPGDVGDTTAGTAFSTATALATQPVTAVNDSPAFALSGMLVMADEDAGPVVVDSFAAGIVAGSATATDEGSQSLVFVLTLINATNTLTFDIEPAIDPLTGDLAFATTANTYGTATFEVLLRDDGDGTPPNVNESSTYEFTIEIMPINDDPFIAVNSTLIAERGAATVVTGLTLNVADVDNEPADLLYSIVAAPSHGSILVDGAPANQFTQAQIDAGVVAYLNDGTANWIDAIDFEVDDGAGGITTGTLNVLIRPHPGDYNRDLIVDAADYSLWRRAAGTTDLTPFDGADGNGDGIVDQADYDIWREHFGDTATLVAGGGDGDALEPQSAAVEAPSDLARDASATLPAQGLPPHQHARAGFAESFVPHTSVPYTPAARKRLDMTAQPGNTNRDDVLAAWFTSRSALANDGVSDSILTIAELEIAPCENTARCIDEAIELLCCFE